jgi:hypothetical protein
MPNYCIKLTNADGTTYNRTKWTPGKWNPAGVLSGIGGLCGKGFYHAYDTDEPVVALLLNPAHANFLAPVVWLAEWRGKREDDSALKMGTTEMRVVRRLDVAAPTDEQRRIFAILCVVHALEAAGTAIPEWTTWADAYLAGERGATARDAARDAARAAAWAAARDAAWDAASAAAWAAAWAASAAASAASAAAWAASAAASAVSAAATRDMLASCAAWAMAWPLVGRDY